MTTSSSFKTFCQRHADSIYIGETFVKFVAYIYCFKTYVAEVTACQGPSMLPTLNTVGDLVFVDRFSYKVLEKSFQKGDVVVAQSPENKHKQVLKRVLATEGEVVSIHSTFNGQKVTRSREIPKGHVWLEGDNSAQSHDSRNYGPVPIQLLGGKVLLRVWPFSQICVMDHSLP